MKQSKSKKSTFTFNTEQMLLNSKASFVVKEAFKTLRTNVMFSLTGNDCKCIGVTSGNRSEGKSLTSINLALSFAQIGKSYPYRLRLANPVHRGKAQLSE